MSSIYFCVFCASLWQFSCGENAPSIRRGTRTANALDEESRATAATQRQPDGTLPICAHRRNLRMNIFRAFWHQKKTISRRGAETLRAARLHGVGTLGATTLGATVAGRVVGLREGITMFGIG